MHSAEPGHRTEGVMHADAEVRTGDCGAAVTESGKQTFD